MNKRSLFIVNDFPPIIGGQSNYYHYICHSFPMDKVIVLAPTWKGDKEFDCQQNFKIIRRPYLCRIPVVEKIGKIVLPIFFIIPILMRERVSYIHCAHILSTGMIGLLFRIFSRIPYLLYTHSADLLEYKDNFFIRPLLRSILRHAQHVIANSMSTKKILLSLSVDASKIILIYPKINSAKFSTPTDLEAIKTKYDLHDKRIILSVNRLVARKGNDKVIEVLPSLCAKFQDLLYVIVGDGPYRLELKRLVLTNNLQHQVFFAGALRNEEIIQMYQICDVFILANREVPEHGDVEGFGMVFLEAGATGKPVIGGNSGGAPEAILHEETGLLVNPTDTNAISNALIRILSDSRFAHSLGRNSQQRIQQRFDWRRGVPELSFLFSDGGA